MMSDFQEFSSPVQQGFHVLQPHHDFRTQETS